MTVRTNAAPTLWALYEATPEHLAPFEDEAEVLDRVGRIREDGHLLARLQSAAQNAEPDYPPSPHLEEQIYGHPFPSRQDEDLMDAFHAATWDKRAALARQFRDERYRGLALRLLYFERPELLAIRRRAALDDAIRGRLMATPDANVPWLSIPTATRDLKALLESDLPHEQAATLTQYLDYLVKARGLPQPFRVRLNRSIVNIG